MAPSSTRKDDYVIFLLVGHRKLKLKHAGPGDEPSLGNICSTDDNGQQGKGIQNAGGKSTECPLMVVAIDLGMTFSGYSFVFTRDKSQVRYMRKDRDKVPTILLLTRNKQFHSFGYEAQNYYHDLEARERPKWYYFENFKMALHNGKGLPDDYKLHSSSSKHRRLNARLVFSLALKHLCSQAMQDISDQLAFTLTPEDIRWVITVPAIWDEAAKQFMRQAALETNLVCPDQLYIALEPEVASLYCRQSYEDHSEKSSDQALSIREICRIKQGTDHSWLVIDAGGGSVDVTFHQIQHNGHLQEVKNSSGLPCGSNQINKAFEEMLLSIVGSELWQEFRTKCATAYIDLMNKFELRKREATLERKKAYNITLSFEMIHFFASKNISIEQQFKVAACPKGLRYSKLGIIRVDAGLMEQLFDSVIEPIKRHVKREINSLLPKCNVEFAFLVGGFAQSAVLRHKLKETLQPETKLIIPHLPHLAVLHGAALFGLDPKIIKIRRAMRTYGIGVSGRLNLAKCGANSKKNQKNWRNDLLDPFVTVNQPVRLFEKVTRRYSPVLGNDQTFCLLHIYSTDQESATFVTEEHVDKCGTIFLELEPLQLVGSVNPAIKELSMKREIEIEMCFGEFEIKITATDLLTRKSVKTYVNFFTHPNAEVFE